MRRHSFYILIWVGLDVFASSFIFGSCKGDTVSPETALTASPHTLTSNTEAGFSFVCDEEECIFECQLDGGGWESCTSPVKYTALSEGTHVFEVVATDDSGNIDKSPESYAWVIDLGINWARTYGGSEWEIFYGIIQTTDGGYLMSGVTNSFGADSDILVIKTRENGEVDWQKRYDWGEYECAGIIWEEADGGYILLGNSSWDLKGDMIQMLKTDSSGNIVWQYTYSGAYDTYLQGADMLSDGGYILVGSREYYCVPGIAPGSTICYREIIALRLNADGEIVWMKRYVFDCVGNYAGDCIYDESSAESVQQTLDGGFIVVGNMYHEEYPYEDGDYSYRYTGCTFIMKLDENGLIQWYKKVGYYSIIHYYSCYAEDVRQAFDGGYIFIGSFGVMKLSSSGDVEWQTTYRGESYGGGGMKSMHLTDDGGFIIGGEKLYSIWLLKCDQDGNIEWQKEYSDILAYEGMCLTNNGGYAVSVIGSSRVTESFDAMVFTLDADGTLSDSCSEEFGVDLDFIPQAISLEVEDYPMAVSDVVLTRSVSELTAIDIDITTDLICEGE